MPATAGRASDAQPCVEAASGAGPAVQGDEPILLVAAWRTDEGERLGLIGSARSRGEIGGGGAIGGNGSDTGKGNGKDSRKGAVAPGWRVVRSLDVPTRAHGLLVEGGDRYLAVARRPGDWLLRWDGQGRELAWAWSEPGRAFNGHVIASADGRLRYTTETDLDTGDGLIGVRDADTLEKIDEWPTGGLDPHELVLDGDGDLMVANGGIPTLPETGRLKVGLERMDASLVRLARHDGSVSGQWRLADRRLSLRHLAWCGDQLGIALQAEHAEAEHRAVAPVLARFDGRALVVCEAGADARFAGYGGDIAAIADGWAVSCPRSGRVALWRSDGSWGGTVALGEACALAARDGRLWIGGRDQVLVRQQDGRLGAADLPPLQLDNHWALGS